MHLFRSRAGNILVHNNNNYLIEKDWDEIVSVDNLYAGLLRFTGTSKTIDDNSFEQIKNSQLLPPIGRQEVWAAGVTYLRSRDARMDESKESGGSDFLPESIYSRQARIIF